MDGNGGEEKKEKWKDSVFLGPLFHSSLSSPSLLRFLFSFRNNPSGGVGFAVLKTLPILRLLPPNVCARNVFD